MENKKTLLLVDDMPDNIIMMMNILKSSYNCKVANNGKKALSILEAANNIDLVLLDIQMPEMDGYEVCKLIKSNEALKDIPVMFVSSNAGPLEQKKAFDTGGIDYILKPVNPSDLLSKVQKHTNDS